MPTQQAPSLSRTRGIAVFVGVLFVLLLALGTEIVQYSRNTLAVNGSWTSSKALMTVSLMGSEHYLQTRNALRRNRLDLGAWFGHNELHWNRVVQPKTIECRVHLNEGAWLAVIFGRGATGFRGVRLSRHPDFDNVLFRAGRSGAYIERKPFDPPEFREAWQQLRLEFGADELTVSLDGHTLLVTKRSELSEQIVGFRGGEMRSLVDEVRVTDIEGRVFEDDFRNTRNRGPVLFGVGLALTLVLLLAGAAAPVGSRGVAILATQAVLVVLFGAYFVFDFYIWAARYPYSGFTPWGRIDSPLPARYEELRRDLLGVPIRQEPEWRTPAVPSLLIESVSKAAGQEGLCHWNFVTYGPGESQRRCLQEATPDSIGRKRPDVYRMIVIGTSQTHGEGAEVRSDTVVARTHDLLRKSLPPELRLESLALAIPGSNSSVLMELFRTDWVRLEPNLVVANLSLNDTDPVVFERNLRELAELSKSHGFDLVFSKEAYPRERSDSPLPVRHQVMTELGQEFDVPVLDLHGYLDSDPVYDSALLWWDFAHLSSQGQELAARWWAPRLRPFLSR